MSLVGTATQKDQDTRATVTFTDGSLSAAEWEGVVWEAVLRINAGEVAKVDKGRLAQVLEREIEVPNLSRDDRLG